MATKKFVTGSLMALVAATLITITFLAGGAKVDLAKDKTTFYLQDPSGEWVPAAVETNSVYNAKGALITRGTTNLSLEQTKDTFTGWRRAKYGTSSLHERYDFLTASQDILRFPNYHDLNLLNCPGCTLEWCVSVLNGFGTIPGDGEVQSPRTYGRIKAEWYNGTAIETSGKLCVKWTYSTKDWTVYARMYDPPINVTLNSVVFSNNESATINITNTNASNVTIFYGLTNFSFPYNVSNSTLASSRLVNITGLLWSTRYFYNVTTCDNAGNCSVNGTKNFTTADNNYLGFANITLNATDTTINVTWDTTGQSTGQVDWGVNASFLGSTYGTFNTTLTNSSSLSHHFIQLTGLTPGTRYFINLSGCTTRPDCNITGIYNVTTNTSTSSPSFYPLTARDYQNGTAIIFNWSAATVIPPGSILRTYNLTIRNSTGGLIASVGNTSELNLTWTPSIESANNPWHGFLEAKDNAGVFATANSSDFFVTTPLPSNITFKTFTNTTKTYWAIEFYMNNGVNSTPYLNNTCGALITGTSTNRTANITMTKYALTSAGEFGSQGSNVKTQLGLTAFPARKNINAYRVYFRFDGNFTTPQNMTVQLDLRTLLERNGIDRSLYPNASTFRIYHFSAGGGIYNDTLQCLEQGAKYQ